MEILHGIGELLQTLGFFGGIGLIILAANKAKLDRMKAERQMWQQTNSGQNGGQNADVIAEMKAMKQQMAEMHSTSHQFDISFDEALSRLEGRIGRVETKVASAPAVASQPEEVQHIGSRWGDDHE